VIALEFVSRIRQMLRSLKNGFFFLHTLNDVRTVYAIRQSRYKQPDESGRACYSAETMWAIESSKVTLPSR